jgi:hypothetical protein
VHQVKGAVDIFQRQRMGNKGINLYLAIHVPVNDAGDVGAAAGTSKGRASP